MKSQRFSLSLVLVLLAGCSFPFVSEEVDESALVDDMFLEDSEETNEQEDEMNSEQQEAEQVSSDNVDTSDNDNAVSSGVYTDFNNSVIGNGQTSVLFFAAAWCPSCRAHDANLQEWYGEENIPLSVYKIDYDTATELKKRYGVVTQDTFVVIDGQGNAVTDVSFPSESALRSLLNG